MGTRTKHVLVTGGAGFIGRHLVRRLVEIGHSVTVVDNCKSKNSKYGKNWLCELGVPVAETDVRDQNRLNDLVRNHEVVVHAASTVGIQKTSEHPMATVEHLFPARTIANCANERQIVIFLSSSDIYGMHSLLYGDKPIHEDDATVHEPPQIPRWAYARMKALSEIIIASSTARTTAIRIFNCYGPDLDYPEPHRVSSQFFHAVRNNSALRINGDGKQIRSFCYIDDLVEGIIKVLDRLSAKPCGYHEVFNIGNPNEQCTIAQLAELVAHIAIETGLVIRKPSIEYHQHLYRDLFNDSWGRVPDIQRARAALGFEPKVSLPEGLTEAAKFWARQLRGVHDG